MTMLLLLLFLVLFPAAGGFFLFFEYLQTGPDPSTVSSLRHRVHHWFHSQWEPGDLLVYRKAKVSLRPGPRARNVHPSQQGDDYYYEVDKYWTVEDVLEDGHLIATTRTGKRVCLECGDEHLRKPTLVERTFRRSRFPSL